MRSLLSAIALGICALAADLQAAEPTGTAFARLGPVAIEGNGRDLLQLGVGGFDIFGDDTAPMANLEYRFGRKLFFLGSTYGLLANTDGGVYGYAGFYLDLSVGRLHLSPMLAIGGYSEGSSKDLGGVFEFRESADLCYRFDNGMRLGMRFAHISNARTQSRNPGENELQLVYSIPLGPYL